MHKSTYISIAFIIRMLYNVYKKLTVSPTIKQWLIYMLEIYNNCKPYLEKTQGECGFCNALKPLVLYETKNFYIILSLGQIIEGYLLICTKQHRSCCGDILLENIDEFSCLQNIVRKVLYQTYNKKVIFYEHGQTGACMKHLIDNMQNHCYHAHLHCVPSEIDIFKNINKQIFRYIKLSNFKELLEIRNGELKGGAYLFYENANEEKFIFPAENIKLPRQFLRRCVAKNIGKSYLFDWEKHVGWKKLSIAYKKLIPLFKKYENETI